ncbi:lariat debranching enzyme, C-terminal domain-containing protein [Pyronema domesticum]|nr:lariat debranching enzyme, C-terminal domain-containing protein [Pyronema domesticum]
MSNGTGEFHEGLRIAVEGCGHGQLNAIYDSVKKAEEENNFVVDLLIICGDFQAMRNLSDLEVMSCPPKYRDMADFHEYYSGKRKAPVLTLFIGGNHEASAYGMELFHGGWVAPNIFYMGVSNVIQVGNLRIGGLSGIYKSNDYTKPHYEVLPYLPNEIKSIYHIRTYDVYKLFQVQGKLDVMLSHDWPANIEHFGDTNALFKKKPFFIEDSKNGELGSPPAESLLKKLQPKYWFSGHLHVKFAAMVNHGDSSAANTAPPQPAAVTANPDELDLGLDDAAATNPDEIDLDGDDEPAPTAPPKNSDEIELDLDEGLANTTGHLAPATKNTDEIDLDLDDEASAASAPTAAAPANPDELSLDLDDDITATAPAAVAKPTSAPPVAIPAAVHNCTRFLALDKCLPHRDFLQILTVPFSSPLGPNRKRTGLYYDPEFLSISRFSNQFPGTTNEGVAALQGLSHDAVESGIKEAREWVEENVVKKDKLEVPENFVVTAPVHEEEAGKGEQPRPYRNEQTSTYCGLLGMEDWVSQSEEAWEQKKPRWESRMRDYEENGRGGHRGRGRGGFNRGGGRGGRGGRGRGGNRGGHGGRGGYQGP